MKKFVFFFTFLLPSLSMLAAETITYRLQQVTEITPGEKYVFGRNNRVIDAFVENGCLKTIDIDLSATLSGKESYVWEVQEDITYPSLYNLVSNLTGHVQLGYDKYTTDLTLNATGVKLWYFEYKQNCVIIRVESNIGPFLALTSVDGSAYRTYTSYSADHPRLLTIYQLIPENYSRDIASEKVGTLGTICLPYQVSSHSGADFYQVAYKTVDAQNHPLELFYEQVTGSLQAGHPYLFVSTSTQLQLPADTDEPQVSNPVEVKGFCGTFKDVQDKSTTDNTNVLVNNYIIYNNQIQLCGLGCGLSPYRAYIKMDKVPLQTSVAAPTRQVVAISQNGQPRFINSSSGTPTALSSAMATDASPAKMIRNGQVLILREGQLYNLFGTRQ